MIDPRIRYVNEPGFGACVLPYFKANFLAAFLLVKQGSLTVQEVITHAPKPGSFTYWIRSFGYR